jgi:hypothetical protein
VGRMKTGMICVNLWLHNFGLVAGFSNQEPIHITVSFQCSSNKSFNCYHKSSLIMMWHLPTVVISNCKVRPLPFTLSLYQCPTWWWLSLKHVVVLNKPNIQHLHSVHWNNKNRHLIFCSSSVAACSDIFETSVSCARSLKILE